MKNKKILIISVIILILLAIILGIYKVRTSYMYNEDGTLSDAHTELIEHLKELENDEERRNKIDFCVEEKLITQEEANELY